MANEKLPSNTFSPSTDLTTPMSKEVETPITVDPAIAPDPVPEQKTQLSDLDEIESDAVKDYMRQGFTKEAAHMAIIKEKRQLLQDQLMEQKNKEDQKAKESAQTLENLAIEEQEIESELDDIKSLGMTSKALEQKLKNLKNERAKLQVSLAPKVQEEELDGQQSDSSTVQQPGQVSLKQQANLRPDGVADRGDLKEAEASINQVSNEELYKQAEAIGQQNIKMQAQQIKANEEIEKQKRIIDEATTKLQKEDVELQKIDPNRLWNSKSTWQKVLAGIGMALGGAPAAKIVQDAINADIQAQKLDNENALAKKNAMLERAKLEIKKLEALTNDNFKKEKLNQLNLEMNLEQKKINDARLQAQLQTAQTRQIAFGLKNGLTSEQWSRLQVLNPKLAEQYEQRAIDLGGKVFTARSLQEANKLRGETIPEAAKALRDLNRLEELTQEIGGWEKFKNVMNLSKKSAEAETIKKSVVGALRLELFGPGVMTDSERAVAEKIIGDPNKIFTIDSVEVAKLQALKSKLGQGLRDRLRLSGIELPKNKNELMIEQVQKNNPNMQRPEIINALRKKGLWNDNAGLELLGGK